MPPAHRSAGVYIADRIRAHRKLVAELPSAQAYSSLAMAERDMGHWRAAQKAYRAAIDLTPPEPEARVTFLRAQLAEVDDALVGNAGQAMRRVALGRVMFSDRRAGRLSKKAELPRLKRWLREALRSGDESSATIYGAALKKLVDDLAGSRDGAPE